MNKISSFFYHILNYGGISFKDGIIYIWGNRYLMFPPKTYFILKKEIENRLGEDGKRLFYWIGYIAGKNATKVLVKRYGFSIKDFDKLTNGATMDGFGYLQIIKYPKQGKKVEFEFKGTNCIMAQTARKEGYKRNFDDYELGVLTGGTSPLFKKDMIGIEKMCVAKGDSYCLYNVKETNNIEKFKLFKQTGINLEEINKKILKQYLSRKNTLTFLEKKDVHFGDGTFRLRGITGGIWLHSGFSLLNYIYMKLINDYDKILDIAIENMLDIVEVFPKLNLNKNLIEAFKKVEIYGLGKFKLISIKENELIIENSNNPLPEEHKYLFGISKKPVCKISEALLKKLINKITNIKYKIQEVHCIAQGRKKCVFKLFL